MITIEKGVELALDRLGEYKIYGSEAVSRCPFCQSEKHKFYLNIETGLYSCKRASCGSKGNINQLLEHYGINDRVKYSDDFIQDKKETKRLNVDMNKFMELKEDDDIVGYMLSRGITLDTLNTVGAKRYGSALVLPTMKDGRAVNVAYRTSDKRIWQESGSMNYLYGRERLDFKNKRIYISEGRVDMLTLVEMGYENCVSMPMGAGNHEWINLEWDLLKKFEEIVLLYDNDTPGKQGFEIAKSRLDFARIFTINLDTYKDINEAYMKDSSFLYQALGNVKEVQLDGFISLNAVSTTDGVGDELYSCGIPQFDTIFGGIRMGESSLVVSPSGTGKSTVLCNMVKGILGQDEKCGVYSGELMNASLKAWIYSTIGGNKAVDLKPHPFRKGEFLTSINKEAEIEIDKKIKGRLWVYDGSKNNAYIMLKNFSALNKRFGVKYFFIDNLSILDMTVKGMGMYESEDHFAKVLAEFCRTHKCHVFLFAHPTKQNLNTDADFVDRSGKVKPIQRYDQYSVRGSATLVNLSHNIMFLMRAKEWEKQYFIQNMREKFEKGGIVEKFNAEIMPKLKDEFSLFAYLVKNRGFGKTFEDALFGYDSNTRRIYGLMTKEEDLSREVDIDEIQDDFKDAGEYEISYEDV